LCCEEAITGEENRLPYRPIRSTRLLLQVFAPLPKAVMNLWELRYHAASCFQVELRTGG